jgi:hypothetical protein
LKPAGDSDEAAAAIEALFALYGVVGVVSYATADSVPHRFAASGHPLSVIGVLDLSTELCVRLSGCGSRSGVPIP